MGRGADDERRAARAVGASTCVARGLTTMSPGELVAELAVSRRAENLELFRRLRIVAAIWENYRPDDAQQRDDRRRGRRDVSGESVHEDTVVTEVAAAMGWTRSAAGRRVDAAVALLVDRRLVRTAELCATGVLDWPQVEALVLRTANLDVERARQVERLVLVPRTIASTIGRFRSAVDRAVIAVDPAGAEDRRKGVRDARRVSFWKNPNLADGDDGAATLWASGPADALAAAMACLDAAARRLRADGDPRTLDQLRHDLLVTGCTTGVLPVPQDLLPVCAAGGVRQAGAGAAGTGAAGTGPAGTGPAGTGPAGTGPAGTGSAVARAGSGDQDASSHIAASDGTTCRAPRPGVPAHITVTVSLQTLLGLNDEPADLAGFGPITAEMARDLAENGIWRCTAVDDTHGTVLGVGRRTWTPGYVPGRALRELLAVAAPTCSIPWCDVPAVGCDQDHRRPYAAGGPTCACNVGPLCRRHHREKSAGHLAVETSTDPEHPLGTEIWTTRAGQRLVVLPYVPLPPEAYRVAPGGGPAGGHGPPGSGSSTEGADPVCASTAAGSTSAADDAPPF